MLSQLYCLGQSKPLSDNIPQEKIFAHMNTTFLMELNVFIVTENDKVKAYKRAIFSIPIPTITCNLRFLEKQLL